MSSCAGGTWWIAPFARTETQDPIGFRMVPGRKLVECPVVWASGPAEITVATRVERLVPVVVLAQMLRAPRRWVSYSTWSGTNSSPRTAPLAARAS